MKSAKYIQTNVCFIFKLNSFRISIPWAAYISYPYMYIRCYIATSVATTNDLIKLEMSHSCRATLSHTVWEALHEIANRSEVYGNAWNLEILQPKLFFALWRPNKPSGRLRYCPLAPPPTSWKSSKASATVPVTTSTTTAPSWVKSCETTLQSFHGQLSTQRLCPTAQRVNPRLLPTPQSAPFWVRQTTMSFRSSSAIRRPQPKLQRSQLQQLRRWRSLRWTSTIIGVLTVDGCYSHSLAD